MRKNWLAIASADHVHLGREEGFMQVCHGKAAPLRRLKPGDYIVYYSPVRHFPAKEKLQSFTAIGTVLTSDPYQVEMSKDFCPFRRKVKWASACETSILPLLQQLNFTKNRKNWGYQFRYGLIAIKEEDMQLIVKSMHASFDF